MTIGQVANWLSVTVQAIRYYEREGLLPRVPRNSAGYRQYDADLLKRIGFIRHAQEVGFTPREIADLLTLRADPDGSCETVQRFAAEKMRDIDFRVRGRRKMKRTLKNLSQMCDRGLDASACPIIEALDAGSDTQQAS